MEEPESEEPMSKRKRAKLARDGRRAAAYEQRMLSNWEEDAMVLMQAEEEEEEAEAVEEAMVPKAPEEAMVPEAVEEAVVPRQAKREKEEEAEFDLGDRVQSWWAPWMEGCTEFPKSISNRGPFTCPSESDEQLSPNLHNCLTIFICNSSQAKAPTSSFCQLASVPFVRTLCCKTTSDQVPRRSSGEGNARSSVLRGTALPQVLVAQAVLIQWFRQLLSSQ